MASSTWCRHFVTLANPPKREVKRHLDALQLYAVYLWPLPADVTLEAALEKVTSLVIVRYLVVL